MAHNLVISNDRDSEYVQFEVNIPDGYNKFNVAYLNGSLINQNYLKVGDILRFTFDNNPLTYDIKAKCRLIYDNPNMTMAVDDDTEYEFINVNMFKYYRIKYIPIYQYWFDDDLSYSFIFNPCDATQLLDEPAKILPPYLVYNDVQNNLQKYGTPTGKYVIALVYVNDNVIPTQTLTIGESISNSRMQPREMGTYQISTNLVNEVNVPSITKQDYSYGSVWHYAVDNLTLTHTETIKVTYPAASLRHDTILLSVKGHGNENFVRNFNANNGIVIRTDGNIDSYDGNNYECRLYHPNNQQSPYDDNIDTILKSVTGVTMEDIPIIKYTGNSKYTCILSGDVVSNVDDDDFLIKGEDVVDMDYYTYDNQLAPRQLQANVDKYFINDWYYTGDFKYIQILYADGTTPLADALLDFGDTPTAYISSVNNTYTISGYDDLTIKVYDYNNESFEYTGETINICGSLQTDDDGTLNIVYTIHTGKLKSTYGYIPYDNIPPTDMIHYNGNEDIIVKAIRKPNNGPYGLDISVKPLHNIIHNISYNIEEDDPDNKITYNVQDNNAQWQDNQGNTLPLLCFIPLKSNRWLISRYGNHVTQGIFSICTVGGFDTKILTNDSCEVYLADGHETLNVEPPEEDDKKFKTFNGTLVFDRSNSRITRIFSNDMTGACIGYLNDLLAAKLSRYYCVCDYRIWDMFIDSNQTYYITNDLCSLKNMYTYAGQIYSGYHELLITSCTDIVKLIASENTINNCIPSLYPEEQRITTTVTTRSEIHGDLPFANPSDFIYKFFHYYTASLFNYPYVGTGINDAYDGSTTVGGCNFLGVYSVNYLSDTVLNVADNNKVNVAYKPIYVMDKTRAENVRGNMYITSRDLGYYTNSRLNKEYYIETLPAYRIYRNSNFEQTDLTITTGGIKLLHPIYLQSTPRILMNNLQYILDYLLSFMRDSYGSVIGRINVNLGGNYIPGNNSLTDYLNVYYPYKRYWKTLNLNPNQQSMVWADFDTFFILNYIHPTSINIYSDNEAIKTSIPGADNNGNEEVISNLETNSMETNAQLFSYKYFKFLDEVSPLSLVIFDAKYVESVYYNDTIFMQYYAFMYPPNDDEEEDIDTDAYETDKIKTKTTIDNYINNASGYNNLKVCKVFITKLGEFLDFPRLLYACCESQVNSTNISVYNKNMTDIKYPLKQTPKYGHIDPANPNSPQTVIGYTDEAIDITPQQVNTYLYGTIFRYHQLSHGYQNFPNELTTDYIISKSLGNRTFRITLYDEFGRKFPNEDTSQGFVNRLYMELYLE